MDIQAEKLEIMKLILETDNPGILSNIKQLFKKVDTSDWWNNLSQNQKDEILLGIEEIKKGDTVDYEEFMSKYR